MVDGASDEGSRVVGLRNKVALLLLALGVLGTAQLAMLTWGDIAQIANARHAAYEAGMQGISIAEAAASPASRQPSAHGKVALMFLIKSELPLEPLWQLFLGSATAAVQKAAVGGRRGGSGHSGWEQLFSVYVHPAPGKQLPQGSLFAGREVAERVETEWGKHSIVDAERLLIRAALQDPLNQRFVLLSESCMPVYSAVEVYTQLLAENRSRINACRNKESPNEDDRRMTWRWQPGMADANVTQELWRKSSQWFMLTRKHAEVVARDVAVDATFRNHCSVASKWKVRFCTSDEHYVPTLLAWNGLEEECTCRGGITYTEWTARAAHPTTFNKASEAVLRQMRGTCNATTLAAAAQEAVGRLLRTDPNGSHDAAVLAALGNRTAELLPPTCPMFGRKVPGSSVQAWLDLLKPVMQAG